MSVPYALMAFCLFAASLVEVTAGVACPPVQTMKNFEYSGIMGRWYEFQRLTPEGGNFTFKCATVDYGRDENGAPQYIWTAISRKTGESTGMLGEITVPDSAEPAKFKVKYTSSEGVGDQWILGTDNITFMVLYDCFTTSTSYNQHVYIWTREKEPADAVVANVHIVLEKNGLNTLNFTKIEQIKCAMKPDHPIAA